MKKKTFFMMLAVLFAASFYSCKPKEQNLCDVPVIDPANAVKRSFKLSDFVDDLQILTIPGTSMFLGSVIQVEGQKMLFYAGKSGYYLYDMKELWCEPSGEPSSLELSRGEAQGQDYEARLTQRVPIGSVGPGPKEYPVVTLANLIAVNCQYDPTNETCLVYIDNGSEAGPTLKYYSAITGEFIRQTRIRYPLREKHFYLAKFFCMDGKVCYLFSTHLNQPVTAWAVVDGAGNTVKEMNVDGKRAMSLAIYNKHMDQKFRDHWLLWGYNDTIYSITAQGWEPAYRWQLDDKIWDDLVFEYNQHPQLGFEPYRLMDTKEWLFIVCSEGHQYYYNKREQILYGDRQMENDLCYFSLAERSFEHYLYDASTDREYLMLEAFPYQIIELLEDEGTEQALSLAKTIDEEGDRVLVLARLKKSSYDE